MRVFVGTSGYSFPAWKGSFYPADIAAAAMLRFYAERLDTVEINNTFYRMPTEKVLAAWAADVPESFRFVLKAPRRITHILRLKDAGETVAHFLATACVMSERLGPLLFQLPPNLKKDLPRLEAFLALIPEGMRAAFEFRHASWMEEDVLDALRAHGAALCIAEDEEREAPFVATAPFGYLRLRRPEYSEADLQAKAAAITAEKWTETFVFFKHEDEGKGPAFAQALRTALDATPSTGATSPPSSP